MPILSSCTNVSDQFAFSAGNVVWLERMNTIMFYHIVVRLQYNKPSSRTLSELLHLQTCISMSWMYATIGPLVQFMFCTCYLIIGSCGIKLWSMAVVLGQKILPTKLLRSWETNLTMFLQMWSLDCLHGSSLILFPNTTSYKLLTWGEFWNKLLASPVMPLLCVSSLIKAAWGTADFKLKLLVDLVLPPLLKSHPPIYLTIPECKSVSESVAQ